MSADPFTFYAVPWIFDVEGGFADRKADRGGVTLYGISLKFLKLVPEGDIDGDGDVDRDDLVLLTKEKAVSLYRKYFWEYFECDRLPVPIALCLFDAGVHHRPGTARLLIQKALDVIPDRIIGPKTRAAASQAQALPFLTQYGSYRALLFHDIVNADSSQGENLRGWFRRLFLLEQYILIDVL